MLSSTAKFNQLSLNTVYSGRPPFPGEAKLLSLLVDIAHHLPRRRLLLVVEDLTTPEHFRCTKLKQVVQDSSPSTFPNGSGKSKSSVGSLSRRPHRSPRLAFWQNEREWRN